MDDAPNLPGWEEYSKRYTAWQDLSLPCGDSESMAEGLSDRKIDALSFEAEIFPNPNTGSFNLRTDMENYTLEVMDAKGNLVYRQDAIQNELIELNLDNLNNGIYLLKLSNNTSVITKRLTIQK